MAHSCSPFIPASLDDAGLTPAHFRVLCHVYRRGECCSKTDTIAKTCRLNRETVKQSLRYLAKLGWIITEIRMGRTNIHRPKVEQDEGGVPLEPEQNKAGERKQMRPGGGTKSGRGPEQNQADKGNPSKGTPPEGVAAQAGSDHLNGFSENSAEEIYQAYPRKVAKQPAIKAIKKALKSCDADWILEQTRQYAVARAGENPKYTPHPATWFNQQRYNDDPVELARKPEPQAESAL